MHLNAPWRPYVCVGLREFVDTAFDFEIMQPFVRAVGLWLIGPELIISTYFCIHVISWASSEKSTYSHVYCYAATSSGCSDYDSW